MTVTYNNKMMHDDEKTIGYDNENIMKCVV